MALATDSTPTEPAGTAAEPGPEKPRHGGPFSPLTRRILAVNALALGILVGGVLYLDRFEAGLIEARGASLMTQGEIIAGALAEAATSGPEAARIKLDMANKILHRLVVPTGTRARLFGAGGQLVADSRRLLPAQQVYIQELPPPGPSAKAWPDRLYDWIAPILSSRGELDLYVEDPRQSARNYAEVLHAFGGAATFKVRRTARGHLLLSVALPVQRLKRVLGIFMLSVEATDIDDAVREQRLVILGIFGTALTVTILLSLFLAATIAHPVRKLAESADQVRRGVNRRAMVPDFTRRKDEIGDLSGALRDMTNALYQRMEEIEKFAADVSHEIKNPLTSLRSAAETFERTDDPEIRGRLARIIQDDVARLDRLITDISDASRLDAELSRTESEPIDLSDLLTEVVDFYRARKTSDSPAFDLKLEKNAQFNMLGIGDRLSQVFQNLIDNALSFSPAVSRVTVSAEREGDWITITVEDDGPGIPANDLTVIFDRFYTARPGTEEFGKHSGLGLSIAKQIIEAHGGTITAANREPDGDGATGAKFVVRLKS